MKLILALGAAVLTAAAVALAAVHSARVAPVPSAAASSGPAPPAPQAATGPARLAETTQLAGLPAPYQQEVARSALVLANALYDLEGWQLTGAWEQQNPCQAMSAAAAMIRADGATPVVAPLSPSVESLVRCAARAASPGGMVHLQAQPHEADLRTYMRKLKNATTWARQEVPGIAVSFGLSTNPKYHATPAGMFAAWRAATTYLGPSTPCWLNILPLNAQSVNAPRPFSS